ncbi:hypothetical protein CYMTET_38172 [Cymbomonas tetramitiformis]|uniref:Uncharacterized protein n=1 Tax=Cymbomonas tetramitiformis TaxID=36881 RepID=A0AAE0CE24_9CHLO|nr:hypothetical protein CYMTET_38172 [Cymbomonas tetramitiformis]
MEEVEFAKEERLRRRPLRLQSGEAVSETQQSEKEELPRRTAVQTKTDYMVVQKMKKENHHENPDQSFSSKEQQKPNH